jgi:OOP family OmpA-OmpF porin
MTPADSAQPHGEAADAEPQGAREWQRLRALLFGHERASLAALRASVGDHDSLARSVASVLPAAAAIRARQDDGLARVLAPVVEDSLQRSVRENPQPLVDALYPIMGPAIRRSIGETLAEMLQAFNGAVEQSFSIRALRWRLDAWRTGRSYADVVLLKTLVYRVEQAFLIHRETGLLLGHCLADRVVAQDPDMVSGMLTAIRDFIGDSFQVSAADGVDAIRLGDLTILVRLGPRAILAAVVRGNAPNSLGVHLSETLESIHLSHAAALATFTGDMRGFADIDRSLQGSLRSQTRAPARSRPWRAYLVMGLLAALIGAAVLARHRTQMDWNAVVAELRREPGLTVIEADAAGDRHIEGLRDPLARDPATVVGADNVRRLGISWNWKPYLSLEPALTLRRAQQLLAPPPGVNLRCDGDVLRATGVASAAWLADTRRRGGFVPGVRAYEDSGVTLDTRAIDAATVYFEVGADTLSPTRRAQLDALLPTLSAFMTAAAELQRGYTLEIIGRADTPGTTQSNLRLSQSRAETVRGYLVAHGLPAEPLRARGVGAAEAATTTGHDFTDADRRVDFRVVTGAAEPGSGATP